MRKTSILIILAGAMALPAYSPAHAVVSGNLEALFTSPTVGGIADATLHTAATSLVDGAATGTTIRVALGTDTDQSLVDRLIAAQNQRGVTVLAVAERCPSGTGTGCAAPATALTNLAGGLIAGRFTWCSEACLSATGSLARNTFLIIDTLSDGRTNVVAQASATWRRRPASSATTCLWLRTIRLSPARTKDCLKSFWQARPRPSPAA